jgi:guanylate kinase
MLVLSSPSGAGKTTLARALLAAETELELSISVTTRAPRPGEAEGHDYHFRDIATFERMRDEGALLEWATVHGNLYGTPRAEVQQRIVGGADVLFDIDWQGARQLAASAPDDVVRVFILPPSGAELADRLKRRAQDGPDVVARRLAGAAAEIRHWDEYDYVIVNDDFDTSLANLRNILAAERQRRRRRTGLPGLVSRLLQDL